MTARFRRALRLLPILLLPVGLRAGENPRAARSVHLAYDGPPAAAFYSEMTIRESVAGSYFMAAGFDRGYFGLQELWEGRKIALFSVWDPDAGDRPQDVPPERQVETLASGDQVVVRRFGGEGTGAQSLRAFDWQPGVAYRFLITAEVEGDRTTYAGRFYDPATSNWIQMATFRTLTGGRLLRGLHSFVEDFRRDGRSVAERRGAEYGPLWLRRGAQDWLPVTRATFTADGNIHTNIDAGVTGGRFYLATGGDTAMSRPVWSHLRVEPAATPPAP